MWEGAYGNASKPPEQSPVVFTGVSESDTIWNNWKSDPHVSSFCARNGPWLVSALGGVDDSRLGICEIFSMTSFRSFMAGPFQVEGGGPGIRVTGSRARLNLGGSKIHMGVYEHGVPLI